MTNSLPEEHLLKRSFITSLFTIILVIGISELLVMLLLEEIKCQGISLTPIQASTLDSVLLTSLSAPLLWWFAVRPLITRIVNKQTNAAEQARLDSELRTTQLNSILDTAACAIITTDKTGTIQSFNKAAEKIFGYNANEIIGHNVKCLMPSKIASKHDSYIQNYLDTNISNIIGNPREVEGQNKNGAFFPILVRINPMRIEGELFFSALIDDISETKILQAQLVQAQKLEAIGQLASGIAHEINTPIQYIGDNLSALKENFADLIAYQQDLQNFSDDHLSSKLVELINKYDLDFIFEDSPKAISQAQEGVDRVAEIVKAMKSFSHLEQSQTKQTTNLHEVLNNALTLSRNNYKYIAEIKTDFDPDITTIECYPNELNQVLINLLTNAAHAIEECQAPKGLIKISTHKLGDSVEIIIQDNGVGIPPQIQDKVFNLFFTTKPVGKGTGQGLSLSYNIIVENHQGKLFFDSTPGIGTTFHIQLPSKPENQE